MLAIQNPNRLEGEDEMRLFDKCGNQNVPEGCEVIGSTIAMSGEIIETYFWQNNDVYCVDSWAGRKPYLVEEKELKSLLKQILKEIRK